MHFTLSSKLMPCRGPLVNRCLLRLTIYRLPDSILGMKVPWNNLPFAPLLTPETTKHGCNSTGLDGLGVLLGMLRFSSVKESNPNPLH